LRLGWRILAWGVAVILGFVLTAVPVYVLGFIAKGDLLNVFVGTGFGRYGRLAVLTAIWALATAVIVTLLLRTRNPS